MASAVAKLGLKYVVVTSVTRDDISDGGAAYFSETIRSIRARNPDTRVEVLIPDFLGSEDALKTVVDACPDVLNHNLETVPRLYNNVRPQAVYMRSLNLLQRVQQMDRGIATKSGLMLGLGESPEELKDTLRDLLGAGCRAITLGQYLSLSQNHHPVIRYIPPDEFSMWEKTAYRMGFSAVASGPFVRSSFHAGDMFNRMEARKGDVIFAAGKT